MTTSVPVINESNMATAIIGSSEDEKTISRAKDVQKDDTVTTASPDADTKAEDSSKKESSKDPASQDDYFPPTPTQFRTVQVHGYPISLTPQTGSTYHYVNYGHHHMTPEPPSPAGHHSVTDMYNVGSFFQPQSFGSTVGSGISSAVGSAPHMSLPMSPPRPGMPGVAVSMVGVIPPDSPLFSRVTSGAGNIEVGGNQQRVAPPSPSIPYIITPQHPSAASNNLYQTYPASIGSRGSEEGNWTVAGLDRSIPTSFPSPQTNQNFISYPTVASTRGSDRAFSFDETVLPASALSLQETGNPTYSPYSTSQTSPGGSVYTHPSWGYGAHPDMYNSTVSPLQQRSISQIPMFTGMPAGGMRPMGPYGQFYPATSPGPPIQTTGSNKGPDGANLFIFHIPNHFTNMDMYQLFHPYGNLLSVRIMVEKDTGRSRGFGFVSYDAPESAALAIKGLNGFAIGNKRLKVQHKQIKSRDLQDRDSPDDCLLDSTDIGFQETNFLPSPAPVVGSNVTLWHEGSMLDSYTSEDVDNKNTIEASEYTVPSGVVDSSALEVATDTEQTPLSTISQLQNALPDIAAANAATSH